VPRLHNCDAGLLIELEYPFQGSVGPIFLNQLNHSHSLSSCRVVSALGSTYLQGVTFRSATISNQHLWLLLPLRCVKGEDDEDEEEAVQEANAPLHSCCLASPAAVATLWYISLPRPRTHAVHMVKPQIAYASYRFCCAVQLIQPSSCLTYTPAYPSTTQQADPQDIALLTALAWIGP